MWLFVIIYGLITVLAMIFVGLFAISNFEGKWRKPRQGMVAIFGLSLMWPILLVWGFGVPVVDFIKALITNDWDE